MRIETEINKVQDDSMAAQLSRTSMMRQLWANTFPDFELDTPVVNRWTMLYDDKTIMKGLKRAYAKSKKFPMEREDCIRYASATMFHESKGHQKFPVAQ